MNQLLEWLSGGDLRSDGLSNEAAAFVLDNPETFSDLFDGLSHPDHVIRRRAADALEKVARSRPDLLADRLSVLLQVAEEEQVPMVLMHVAMILGHLAGFEEHVGDLYEGLVRLLCRESVFVRSWAVVGLCIIGILCPSRRSQAIDQIAPLQEDGSIAIRTRVRRALGALTQEGSTVPRGWIKADGLKHLERSSPVA